MSVKSKGRIINRKKLRDSFSYAIEGISTAYKEEQNLRVHTIIAILVLVFGFILKISKVEFFVCLILIGLVLMAEFFNTAIESMVDMITMEENIHAKKAKDVAAAGVLVFALTSAIIGLSIFLPKIIDLVEKVI